MTNLLNKQANTNYMASRGAFVEGLMNDIDRVYNEADNIMSDGRSTGERLDYIICAWPEKIEEFTLRAIGLDVECWFVEYRQWAIARERQVAQFTERAAESPF
jgi:hypothetical protein